jgi:hypothetical protein
MGLFGKNKEATDDEVAALETYKVIYKGGHADLPKAKSGEIRMVLTAEEFRFNPTIGSKSYWQPLQIPYGSVTELAIVARQGTTVEKLLGGPDAPELNQENNINISYVDGDGNRQLLRFEMLSGVTVQGQAKRCREFTDRLRVLGISDQFQQAAPATAAAAPADIPAQIAQLAALRDQGILSAEEFETKKSDLLSRM